jgi:hypothetical protein
MVEKKMLGESFWGGEEEERTSYSLKVSRQCQLVLLIRIE